MLNFAVVLILFIASSFGSSNISEDYEAAFRIVKGSPTTIKNFPYQLALYRKEGNFFVHWCGASVLSNRWVLTAAHCVHGKEVWQIHLRSGSTFRDKGGKIHNVDRMVVHPSFNSNSLDYDVAVLQIHGSFQFSDVVKSIPLAHKTPADGAQAVVSGWGMLHDRGQKPLQLHKVNIHIINHRTCLNNYHGFRPVTPRMLCAGIPQQGMGACVGDSGGPLVVAGQQVGVVSWGDVCGVSGGVYADVANLRQWITSNTGVH